MGLFGRGHEAHGSAQDVKTGQRRAIARDMRARGLNPVTVADVKQRHSSNADYGKDGRPILSRQLH